MCGDRLSKMAMLPARASTGAAGYDLSRYCIHLIFPWLNTVYFSAHALVVPAHGKAIVPTDLAIALPEGTYGLFWFDALTVMTFTCFMPRARGFAQWVIMEEPH